MGLLCVETRVRSKNNFKLRAKTSIIHQNTAVRNATSAVISSTIRRSTSRSVRFTSEFKSSASENVNHGFSGRLLQDIDISSRTSISGAIYSRLSPDNSLNIKYADKLGGHVQDYIDTDFTPTQKLYPSQDISTDSIFNQSGGSDLYSSIDEGIYVGDPINNLSYATRISDDIDTYIQPSSNYTGGDYSYSFNIDPITLTPKNSFLAIRAAAPVFITPPEYKISNITLFNPSGNRVITYDDIVIYGDANFQDSTLKQNFTTYFTPATLNRFDARQWDENYPFITSTSGYYVSFDISVLCKDDPFSSRFNFGYLDSCDTGVHVIHSGNPVDSLRISAIEILTDGTEYGLLREDKLSFITAVNETGNRITRRIHPVQILDQSYSNDIYPSSISSTWVSSSGIDGVSYYNNTDGSSKLVHYITSSDNNKYITLDYTQDVADSGKLFLKFAHQKPKEVIQERIGDGPFNIGYDAEDRAFNYSTLRGNIAQDTFFTIDEIELVVVAKKAAGSRDYSLDVVGYSDDKILNVTSRIGGFLQNIDGSGTLPTESGYRSIDDLGISTHSLSEKDQYYYGQLTTNNAGGDHYLLSASPVINSEDFEEYTIPLKIYKDSVDIGESTDYSMSSYFESLYLDIFPIPSGASISKIYLNVYSKPSNGIYMHTLGSNEKVISYGTSTLLPSSRNSKQSAINFGDSYSPLSELTSLPHSYSYPEDLKTNYARRWRGVAGSVFAGPYDANSFDFAFYNPQLNYPFNLGYFLFNDIQSNSIYSEKYSLLHDNNNAVMSGIGTLVGTYVGDINIVNSVGSRFKSGNGTTYQTIDWTSKAGYENDPLYGKIADSFDKAVYVSGVDGYINFGDFNCGSGFAVFARFAPLSSMSGVSYNLYNSGIIFSKYDAASDLEFALGFENQKFTAYAGSGTSPRVSIQDSGYYYDYSYPVSIALTYNDNQDNKLRLYIDNERSTEANFNILRATSDPFIMHDGSSDLTFGYSDGYGIGVNGLITDIGISSPINNKISLTEQSVDKSVKQTSALDFFDSIRSKFWQVDEPYTSDRYKLWQYVNEDTSNWHLGAFRLGFSPDYDGFKERDGASFVYHHLSHHGSGYGETTDITLPSSDFEQFSYHSQIENDMLRFHLGYENGSFASSLYSPNVRISKSLPRGYNFLEDACSVETMVQVESDSEPVWPDGNRGAKLIVSLYTTSKDAEYLSGSNLGLVTRDIHYLPNSSGNIQKVISLFDYNKMTTEDESWSAFDGSQYITELNHKYFSKDIEEMFLQYDLAYPSGSAFESQVTLHSCSIKLVNSLIFAREENASMNLLSSGDYFQIENLNMSCLGGIQLSVPPLLSSDWFGSSNLGFLFYTSGTHPVHSDELSLHTIAATPYGPLSGVNLFIDGTDSFEDNKLLLYLDTIDLSASDNLELYTFGSSSGIRNLALDLFTYNSPGFEEFPGGSMNLVIHNTEEYLVIPIDGYEQGVPLGEFYSGSGQLYNYGCNLYINAVDPRISYENASSNLFVKNLPPVEYSQLFKEYISWDSATPGVDIEINDEAFASIPSTDAIRGVDIVCYGSCSGVDTGCLEEPIISHDIVWYDGDCNDGGILRARNTYTNLDLNFYNDLIPYSGHYYGIRKYEGLIPNTAYRVVMAGYTGSSVYIYSPQEFRAWDDSVKFIADDPYVESGRQVNDKYGYSADIVGNLAAVGSPYHSVADSGGYMLDDAGTVFVYRRDPAPTGFDWSLQARVGEWNFEAQLQLPDSILRDGYSLVETELFPDFFINQRQWFVGQEGRNLGHAVKIAKPEGVTSEHGNDKEIIVTSGPSAKFSREFDELQSSGVNVALFVFTDRVFTPTIETETETLTYLNIVEALKNKDLEFRYLSDPPVNFNIKLAVCQAVSEDSEFESLDFPPPKPQFIIKKIIDRHTSVDSLNQTLFDAKDETIYNSMVEIFHELFPYNDSKLNNNIPPLLGVLVDSSASLGQEPLQPALGNFIDYYHDYALSSGLNDFFGVASEGFAQIFESQDRNWIDQSISVLTDITDIDRLTENDALRYFTSGILEQGNTSLSDFNILPSSGGAVYLFEKEYEDWNLIQIINSPISSNAISPDRFGHAIDISKDGRTIVVGSPYIDQAISVYQYYQSEKDKVYDNLYSWILFNVDKYGTQRYSSLRNSYVTTIRNNENNLPDEDKTPETELTLAGLSDVFHQAAKDAADRTIYLLLTHDEKYNLRSDSEFWNNNPPQEFKLTYTYNYSDITYRGDWKFLLDEFAPTSRLGYSVAVSDDGYVIAAGAPTDSLDEYDHTNTYYNPDNESLTTWPSYVNTGAVRIFEARNYYPHNKAVEYSKFGNFAKSEDSYDFSHLPKVYEYIDIDFETTDFLDLNIPQDAGLAFIINPEVDFVNEEIINNIKNWLALGDRNLVIVGNDPSWEGNGKYFESNLIVNKLLTALGSRMNIYPANSKSDALAYTPSGENTITASKPVGSLSHEVTIDNMTAFGVGDIRMNWPVNHNAGLLSLDKTSRVLNHEEAYVAFNCDTLEDDFSTLNSYCSNALSHGGDLRTQWTEYCDDLSSKRTVNWPRFFNNDSDTCPLNESTATSGYAPIPLIAAAETYVETIEFPDIPESSGLRVIGNQTVNSPTSVAFGSTLTDNVVFSLFESNAQLSGIYNSFDYNINSVVSEGAFFNPDEYNNTNAILQAKATNDSIVRTGTQDACDKHNFAMMETWSNQTSSKIVGISSLETEQATFLDQGVDVHRLFYTHLVRRKNKRCSLAQLGGWTGRTSFKSAKSNSFLKSVFIEHVFGAEYITVDENVGVNDLLIGTNDGKQYDVCWIANPTGLPTTAELNKIKEWLNRGNKKLFITYDRNGGDYTTVNNAKELFNYFGLSMSPVWLNEKNRYAISNIDYKLKPIGWRNSLSDIIKVNSSISELVSVDRLDTESISLDNNYVPLCGDSAETLAYSVDKYSQDYPVIDNYTTNIGVWRMNTGVAKASFPAVPASGYTIFVDVVAEDESENQGLRFDINNATLYPYKTNPSFAQTYQLRYLPDNSYITNIVGNTSQSNFVPTSDGNVRTYVLKVQALPSSDNIEIYIQSDATSYIEQQDRPKTPRIVGISGCLTEIVPSPETQPIYGWVVNPAVSGISRQISEYRPISHSDSRYCDNISCAADNEESLIANGPVIAAQELEVFSTFANGFTRSRITVLSDVDLIAGDSIYKNGTMNQNNIDFLRSLYPSVTFPTSNAARQYNMVNKVKSLELGSPQRFFNAIGNNGINLRFDTSGVPSSGRAMSDFHETIDSPDSIDSIENVTNSSEIISQFEASQDSWGGTSKFAGEYNGKSYSDESINGGMPQIMIDTNHDYLDLEYFVSGYPGDLFGYSLSINGSGENVKILVGSPFSAYVPEEITSWDDVVLNSSAGHAPYNTKLSFNGGAGAAYLYEKTLLGTTIYNNYSEWECTRKFRPESINVGQDLSDPVLASGGYLLGPHSYTSEELSNYTIITDQFGREVCIESDIIVIGAPGHDFDIFVPDELGDFFRREFSDDFGGGHLDYIDLGLSGNRYLYYGSGNTVLNNGAIYTYENDIVNMQTAEKEWSFVQKTVANGHNARVNSENDYFGSVIAVNRVKARSDADYSMIIGTPLHQYAPDSVHASTQPLEDAGCAYFYDAFLTGRDEVAADPRNWISATAFGDKSSDVYKLSLQMNNSSLDKLYTANGIIYSNTEGEIFIEASGQDFNERGFVAHRPYISSIYGKKIDGTFVSPNTSSDSESPTPENPFTLYINGRPPEISGAMNLSIIVSNTDSVYNNIGFFAQSSYIDSGNLNLVLISEPPSGSSPVSGINMFTKATDFSIDYLDIFTAGY